MILRLAIRPSRAKILATAFSLLAATLNVPSAALAQSFPADRAASFDRGDRLSRALLSTLRCAGSVSAARARGQFGPIDSLGGNGQCIAVNGKWVGVFFDADSLFTRITRFSAVDLRTGARRTEPLDTAAVLAVARAESAAQMRGVKAFDDANRPYAPVASRFDGDSIEVWLLPEVVLTGQPISVGGERGFHFTPDGRTLVREVDSFADLRPVAMPDSGTVQIRSRGTDVPTLTEFLLANALHEQGRPVSIVLPWGQATLVGRGAQATWVQAVR